MNIHIHTKVFHHNVHDRKILRRLISALIYLLKINIRIKQIGRRHFNIYILYY